MSENSIASAEIPAVLRDAVDEVVSLFANGAGVLGSAARERQLHQLLDAISAAIYTTDAEGRVTFYNEAAVELAGRRPRLGEDLWCVTWRLFEADGTPLPHDRCPMAVALKENRAVRGKEAIAERPDGTRVPILPFPTPLRDENGALIGAVNLLVDISERKAAEEALRASEARYRRLNETLEERIAARTNDLSEANRRLHTEAVERERTEAALRQAQKMEAIGQLAAGMAHDFNNLLTAVLGNLELIEARVADTDLLRMVHAASRAVLRGAQLNEHILAFCRKQHLAPRPVDLNAIVEGMSELLHQTLGGTISVTTALAPDLWPAFADPTQLELVILNLGINARDALPSGGAVRIGTRNVPAVEATRGMASQDYVCVSVSDDGEGMSADVLSRACEPFFTTKEPGKGTGLGLSQVYGVARQLGGDIVIDSAVGKGTTVAVYLPRTTASSLAAPGPGRKPRPGRQVATVLVVDDQPEVREVVVSHLKELGYTTAEAENGHSALRLIAIDPAIELMIADYAMVEMNGIELAQAARRLRPELPVVMMTGYSDVETAGSGLPDMRLLRKPYRLRELAEALAETWQSNEGRPEASANVVAFPRA